MNDNTLNYLRGLVRQDIRRHRRGVPKLAAKLGAGFDQARPQRRLEFVESVYRELGGDPSRITNLPS